MFLANINHTQAAKRAKNAIFCPWWPWPLTFKLVWGRDQTHLLCKSGANPFSSSQDIPYTNKKTTDWQSQKQNLLQFTARCNDSHIHCDTELKIFTLPRIMNILHAVMVLTTNYICGKLYSCDSAGMSGRSGIVSYREQQLPSSSDNHMSSSHMRLWAMHLRGSSLLPP